MGTDNELPDFHIQDCTTIEEVDLRADYLFWYFERYYRLIQGIDEQMAKKIRLKVGKLIKPHCEKFEE